MRYIVKSILFTSAVLMLALIVFPAAAQIAPLGDRECGGLGIECKDATTTTLSEKIVDILNAGLVLASLAAVIAIIYGGVKYISSAGDEKQADTAKHIILYAIIGLIVIGLAAATVNFAIDAVSTAPTSEEPE